MFVCSLSTFLSQLGLLALVSRCLSPFRPVLPGFSSVLGSSDLFVWHNFCPASLQLLSSVSGASGSLAPFSSASVDDFYVRPTQCELSPPLIVRCLMLPSSCFSTFVIIPCQLWLSTACCGSSRSSTFVLDLVCCIDFLPFHISLQSVGESLYSEVTHACFLLFLIGCRFLAYSIQIAFMHPFLSSACLPLNAPCSSFHPSFAVSALITIQRGGARGSWNGML